MQVFKLFFKVLRRYIGSIIMYACIFLALVLGIIVPQASKNNVESYTQSKSKFAVFDYDESKLSKELIKYLESRHRIISIENDEKETIQDELYNINVDCVIRINDGFEESFLKNEGAEFLEIYEIPNEIGSVLLRQHLNSYLSTVKTYVDAGFSLEEAAEKSVEVAETTVEVEFASESNSDIKPVQYYYTYLSWVFIAMCVETLAAVLIAIGKKEVKNRIECSSYKFMRMNMETILAVLVTGGVICVVFACVSFVGFSEEMLKVVSLFYILNAFCMMAVALAITFLVSKLTENRQVISLMANIVGLGMAFLCGVFVPLEVLSDSVVKIAHFLPAYWYVKAVDLIGSYKASDLGTLLSYMGIQLLFAVAIICIGIIVARRKRGVVA